MTASATLTDTAPPGLIASTHFSRSTSGAAPNNCGILPSLAAGGWRLAANVLPSALKAPTS